MSAKKGTLLGGGSGRSDSGLVLRLRSKYRPPPTLLAAPWDELGVELRRFNIDPRSPHTWLTLAICLVEERLGRERTGPKSNERDDAILAAVLELKKRTTGSYRKAAETLAKDQAWEPFLTALLPNRPNSRKGDDRTRVLERRARSGRENLYVAAVRDEFGEKWPDEVVRIFRDALERERQPGFPFAKRYYPTLSRNGDPPEI